MKCEQEKGTMSHDLDQMIREASMSEDKATRAMVARYAEELRFEQDHAMQLERDRKLLEAQVTFNIFLPWFSGGNSSLFYLPGICPTGCQKQSKTLSRVARRPWPRRRPGSGSWTPRHYVLIWIQPSRSPSMDVSTDFSQIQRCN